MPLTARGDRSGAVDFFNTSIGVPEEIIAQLRDSQPWEAMEKVAHTLVYDSLLSEAGSVDLLRSVTVPTLVLDSEGSTDDLTGMAGTVAGYLPNGRHRCLPGEWHGVPDEVLAPELTAFLTA